MSAAENHKTACIPWKPMAQSLEYAGLQERT